MPVSIPTVLALNFVRKKNLYDRINTLQRSYLAKYCLFGSAFLVSNLNNFNYYDSNKLFQVYYLE